MIILRCYKYCTDWFQKVDFFYSHALNKKQKCSMACNLYCFEGNNYQFDHAHKIRSYNHQLEANFYSSITTTSLVMHIELNFVTTNQGLLTTFINPNKASFQLAFKGLLRLLGLRSQIKSTPQILPRWLWWLTHWKTNNSLIINL